MFTIHRTALRALVLSVSLPVATALAHPGTPGHTHPELPAAMQALHAAANWAPVLLLGAFGLWAARRARRSGV